MLSSKGGSYQVLPRKVALMKQEFERRERSLQQMLDQAKLDATDADL